MRELNRRASAPSESYPTVRCWTHTEVVRLLRESKEAVLAVAPRIRGLKSRRPSSLLQWLISTAIAHPVPLTAPNSRATPVRFYILEFGTTSQVEVDPLELLMAYCPTGVICYWSALFYHQLTVQPCHHHHVCRLDSGARSRGLRVPAEAKPSPRIRPPSRHGTPVFLQDGTEFCISRRKRYMVPGVESRMLGPRTSIRITAREQSLLDAIQQPFSCGGPEVVFEAWGNALEQIDFGRLVDLVAAIDLPTLARRAGALMDFLGWEVPPETRSALRRIARMDPATAAPVPVTTMLPGMPYTHLDASWRVTTP